MGRCKQKQCLLRGLLRRWSPITEWEMYITAQGPRLQNDLYCVEWDVKLYYTIPYHTIPYLCLSSSLSVCMLLTVHSWCHICHASHTVVESTPMDSRPWQRETTSASLLLHNPLVTAACCRLDFCGMIECSCEWYG